MSVVEDVRHRRGSRGLAGLEAPEHFSAAAICGHNLAAIFAKEDQSVCTEFPVRSSFETTPLLMGGVLYIVTAFDRLIAIEPAY